MMHLKFNKLLILTFLFTIIFLPLLFNACLAAGVETPGRIQIVASIFPLADFASQVGGDKVEVSTLLSPGASPETFEPKPRQIQKLARSDIFILNGDGLEFWAEKIIRATANPKLVVVDTSRAIPVEEKITDPEPAHMFGINPHFWLDPLLAEKQVDEILKALVKVDPANKDFYENNAKSFIAELKNLDRQIRLALQSYPNRHIITFHSSWSYFARRYGLVEAAVIEQSPGKEPSPGDLQKIIQAARDNSVKIIFAEAQFNPKAAEVIAGETGARLVFLDPLGGADLKDRNSYLSMMQYNLSQINTVIK